MAAYIINYDLHRPGQRYNDLYEEIKSYGPWWHQLESTWIIITSVSAASIRDQLLPFLDQNDELVVVRLGKEAAWNGISVAAADWLREHL